MTLKAESDQKLNTKNNFLKMQKMMNDLNEAIFLWKERTKKKTDKDLKEKLASNDNEVKEETEKGNKKKIIVNGASVFGINNIGNTCFFNATLQCLNSNRNFVKHYIEKSEEYSAYGHCLKYGNVNFRFSNFLEIANSGKKNSVNPKSLFKCLIAM